MWGYIFGVGFASWLCGCIKDALMREVVGFIQLACALTLGMAGGLGRPPDGCGDGMEWVLIARLSRYARRPRTLPSCYVPASALRPAAVIVSQVTWIGRLPPGNVPRVALASPCSLPQSASQA